jgi:iron(III) transport system substrate-binding protein
VSTPTLAQETKLFPALDGATDARTVTVYSSLDEPLARPMIAAFQAANPDIAVAYEDLQTVDIYDRVVAETDAGGVRPPTSPSRRRWICR